jgi:hypothetical protein
MNLRKYIHIFQLDIHLVAKVLMIKKKWHVNLVYNSTFEGYSMSFSCSQVPGNMGNLIPSLMTCAMLIAC